MWEEGFEQIDTARPCFCAEGTQVLGEISTTSIPLMLELGDL